MLTDTALKALRPREKLYKVTDRDCPAARNMDPRSASNPDPSIA
jgi:hypothetical protein